MKRIQFVLGTFLLAVLAVGVSSFTVKDYNSRAFEAVYFYYDGDIISEAPDLPGGDCLGGDEPCGFAVDEAHLDQFGQPLPYVITAVNANRGSATHQQVIPATDPSSQSYNITYFNKE